MPQTRPPPDLALAHPWLMPGLVASFKEVLDRRFYQALRESHGALNLTSLNAWLKASVGDIGVVPRARINFEEEVAGHTTREKVVEARATLALHTPLDVAEAQLRREALESLRYLADLFPREAPEDERFAQALQDTLRGHGGGFDVVVLNAWVKRCLGEVGTLPRTGGLSFVRDLKGKTTTARLRAAVKTLEQYAPKNVAEAELLYEVLDALAAMVEMAEKGGL